MPPRDARRTKRDEGRRLIVLSIAVLVLVGSSLSALLPLISESGWWFRGIAAAAFVLLAAVAVRAFRGPALLATFAALAAAVVVVTIGFASDSAVAGIIPTPATIDAFVGFASDGGRAIYLQSIPATPDQGMLFLLIAGCCLAAVVLDALIVTARMPLVGGVIALGIALPSSLMTGVVAVAPLAATGGAFLLVLWVDGMSRRRVTMRDGVRVVAVGAVAVTGAGLLTVSVPGFYGGSLLTSASSRSIGVGVSPLIDLGKDLQSVGGIEQFRYTTTAQKGPYFRLMTLESFDGTTWVSSDEDAEPEEFGPGAPLRPLGAREEGTPTAQSTIVIDQMRDRVLPIPRDTVQIDGLHGTWLWDRTDMTVRSRSSSTVDQHYTVTSLETEPTREQLRAATGAAPERLSDELDLGDDVPDIITRTLERVTASADTAYDKAYAIQSYLRGTDFSYSLSTPVQQGYDGDSLGVVATFLERKSGYCVHFASTMAVMSRLAGIPSRIVLGFLPGDRMYTAPGQASQYSVESDDLHAWPELYFDGIGWVAFEPTPSRGSAPDYAPAPEGPAPAPIESELPRANVDTSPTPTASVPQSDTRNDAQSAAKTEAPVGTGIIVLGVLLLLAAPALGRTLRSHRRRALLRAGRAGAALAWNELEDAALDLGHSIPENVTPRSFGDQLATVASLGSAQRSSLARLVRAVERDLFGPSAGHVDGGALVDDLDVVTTALHDGASPRRRLAASLAPRSVLRPRTQLSPIAQR